MARLTLDAGPVIAYEREDIDAVRIMKLALRRDVELTISAATVAEVWRGGPRSARVARVLAGVEVVDVDAPLAKRAGVLLAEAGASHAVDALVVATAEAQRAAVVTSDPDDLRPIADAAGVAVREL